MLDKLTGNVFYMPAEERTDRPVLGVVCGKNRSFIIDSGNSPAHARQFIKKISTCRVPPPRFLGLTHWHWDHTFGMSAWDIPVIAQEETRIGLEKIKDYDWDDEALNKRVEQGLEIEFCAEMIKKEFAWDRSQIRIELPEMIFPDRVTVDLGGRTCRLESVGGDHDPGSTVIFIPEDKVLFLGDCLAPDLYAPEWYYSVERFLPLLEKLKCFGAEIFLPGHGNPLEARVFNRELEEWEEIARAVEKMGEDKEGVVAVAKEKLCRELSSEEEEMVEFFMNGLARREN